MKQINFNQKFEPKGNKVIHGFYSVILDEDIRKYTKDHKKK